MDEEGGEGGGCRDVEEEGRHGRAEGGLPMTDAFVGIRERGKGFGDEASKASKCEGRKIDGGVCLPLGTELTPWCTY